MKCKYNYEKFTRNKYHCLPPPFEIETGDNWTASLLIPTRSQRDPSFTFQAAVIPEKLIAQLARKVNRNGTTLNQEYWWLIEGLCD